MDYRPFLLQFPVIREIDFIEHRPGPVILFLEALLQRCPVGVVLYRLAKIPAIRLICLYQCRFWQVEICLALRWGINSIHHSRIFAYSL
jgi:hypothetical protein